MCSIPQSCLILCNSKDCSPPDSSAHRGSPGKNTGERCHARPLQGDLTNPGTEPRSPALQVDSLPTEPPGKPKTTGIGSLSLLQGNFPTQESNQSPALHVDSLPAELPGKPLGTNIARLKTYIFIS